MPAAETYHLNLNEIYPQQAFYGFQLEPDGRRLLYVSQSAKRVDEVVENGARKLRVTPDANLYFWDACGGRAQPLTSAGNFVHPAAWSPDGRWLAFEQGDQLHVMAADGGERRVIYRGALYRPPAVQAPGVNGDACWGYPRWSPDGASLLIACRDDDGARLRLVQADGTAQRDVLAAPGSITGWDWAPDGRRVVCVIRHEDGWRAAVCVVDVATGAAETVCMEDHYPYQAPAAAWASGGRIILRSNRSGWSKLYITSSENGETAALTGGAWDEYAFRVAPGGDAVVYASRAMQTGSGDDLWLQPLAGGEAVRLTRQPGVNVPLAWAPGGEIYYWHTDPGASGDVWRVAATGGAPQRLTWNTPVALARKLRAPQEVALPGEAGQEIPALIYRPVYEAPAAEYPAIVWIHGGPTMAARYAFAPYHHWLANLGYTVIVPNYRGSVGYGVAHMEAVSGAGMGKNDLYDILAAGKHAHTLTGVDVRRGVGVGGHSWGGYLTLLAMTQAPDAFACGVAGAAISDWRIQQAATEVRYYDRWLVGGWVYEHPGRAAERSPINFVGQLKAPLFIFHGTDDTSVPYAQIEEFAARGRQAGAALETVVYPLEGHSNRRPENQADVLARTKAFYQRHLQAWNLRDNPCAGQI